MMAALPKILLVDDDQAFLDLYQEMLSRHLPSMPEVRTASSGARALALLESEPFAILCVDLNMPKMDGLQVLSIARRKYPQLRLVCLTAMRDEQFRARAYALGIDQFWVKPEADHEIGLLMESIESLLTRENQGGFRGVQSKSLVDIIQLECLSQSSTLLKITNGHAEGRIWIDQGEVIDAEAGELTAEPAFQRILSWKAGSFELLPRGPERARTIFTSYQGLLLNTAQAIDEAISQEPSNSPSSNDAPAAPSRAATVLTELSQLEGIEFVLAIGAEDKQRQEYWGLENANPMAEWTREALNRFNALGEQLRIGTVQQIIGSSLHRKVTVAPAGDSLLCVGFASSFSADQLRETMKDILTTWAS
jgi:CheY-like chemotaxis protein